MKRLVVLLLVTLAIAAADARGDILRWDNGEVIPGTEGIVPGPGVDLDLHALEYAQLSGVDLTDASLRGALLTHAKMVGANLTRVYMSPAKLDQADFTGANLTSAYLLAADLTGANFTGATVRNTDFDCGGATGCLTRAQLESTASYQAYDLRGIDLSYVNTQGWDFRDQDLTGAILRNSASQADFSGANLTDAFIAGSLTNTDLSGAIINGALFTDMNVSAYYDQFRSTASYLAKDLQRVRLPNAWLRGWDFQGQNLSGANLNDTELEFADFTGAILKNASMQRVARPAGFKFAQLQSTASYLNKDLQGIDLSQNVLNDWSFAGQNLTGANLSSSSLNGADFSGATIRASFSASNLTNANFSNANLSSSYLADATFTNANFSGAIVHNANLRRATTRGFTRAQLESTASYQAKDLHGMWLESNDLADWNFQQQNLSFAVFTSSRLEHADFSGAFLMNANFFDPHLAGADFTAADLRGALFDLDPSVTTTNAILPDGKVAGLDLAAGDRFTVCDDDGVPPNQPYFWLTERGPLPVAIQEHFTMSDGGALRLVFEVDEWGSLISFADGIPVQLGGMLELGFAGGVDIVSQVGRTIRIFDWTGVDPSGAFAVASPFPWDVIDLYATGEITLLLPGDTNGDQAVDITDLNSVRNNFGAAGGPGDTNGDQLIDIQDLNNVRNFFGASAPQAVPEPGALVLAGWLAAGALGARWRRWIRD